MRDDFVRETDLTAGIQELLFKSTKLLTGAAASSCCAIVMARMALS